MNNKGFTLVELLATLSIMVLLGLVIGVNITSILRSTEKQNENFDKEQIEKAACVYADSEELCPAKNCNSITLDNLARAGLLDQSYAGNNKTVTVTRNSGEKKCTYND